MVVVIESISRTGLPQRVDNYRSREIKCVTCIIRGEKLDLVTDALNQLNLVGGMTVTDLYGRGHENAQSGIFMGRQFSQTYHPRVKIEIIIESSDVEQVENLISKLAQTGEIGDGKVFVQNITHLMRVRTGEKGISAL